MMLRICLINKLTLLLQLVDIMQYQLAKKNQLVEEFDKRNKANNIYLSITELTKKSYNEKIAIANKLHRQFGHSTSEKLKKLMQSSNIENRESLVIIDIIDNECQICMKYKKLN